MRIYGVDFTSAPRARKPITVAAGAWKADRLVIDEIEALPDFDAFERFLQRPGPWVAGFDFPFGLSREAVVDLAWPATWPELLAHCRQLGRIEFKRLLDAYRQTRPKGNRYARRLGDAASGAHPSVKFVNPPVAYMFLEGATRLRAAGLHIPGLHDTGGTRVALEAYPGMLVRKHLGIAQSYKSDTPAKQTAERRRVRLRITSAIESSKPFGISLRIAKHVRAEMVNDGSGDALDSVLCALQACWGWQRRTANYGLPAKIDPLEGWIVSA